MANLIPTLAIVAAGLGFTSAFLSRRKLKESLALLADTSLRFDAAWRQNKQLEHKAQTNQENIDRFKQQAVQYDRHLDEIKLRLQDRSKEVENLKRDNDEQLRRAQLQKEHLSEQVAVMTEQLLEAVKEKKALHGQSQQLQKETAESQAKHIEHLRTQVREAQQTAQDAKREKKQFEDQLAKLRTEANTVSPEELKRYRLKLARTEQLYVSMKGLRELAEERNRNWETALRHFSLHILKESADSQAAGLALGPLVVNALEKIGTSLVIETAYEAAQAERAHLQAGFGIGLGEVAFQASAPISPLPTPTAEI